MSSHGNKILPSWGRGREPCSFFIHLLHGLYRNSLPIPIHPYFHSVSQDQVHVKGSGEVTNTVIKTANFWAEEMAQQLRAHTGLAEDLSPVPCTTPNGSQPLTFLIIHFYHMCIHVLLVYMSV